MNYQRRNPDDTTLYKIVKDHYPTFQMQKRYYPDYVYRTFEAFLECGDLSKGFMRTKCPDCDKELIVALSCKKRGFCSSCGAKRSAETTAHLVDNILPTTGYRQIVLTLPISLRYWCATNRELLTKVYNIIKKALLIRLSIKAKALGIKNPALGFITFIHNWSSSLALNPHFHILVMDASCESTNHKKPLFKRFKRWNDKELEDLLQEVVTKTIKYLTKKGYLNANEEIVTIPPLDKLIAEHRDLQDSLYASLHNLVLNGDHRGKKVVHIGKGFGYEGEDAIIKKKLCLTQNGFDIHASRTVNPLNRKALFELVSYMARPAISTKRLSIKESGEIQYDLKRPWSDSTTSLRFSPLDFICRLAALVPPPRMNMVKYVGIFSPNHPLRRKLLPNPHIHKATPIKESLDASDGERRKKVKDGSWAKLLSRVFACDVGRCFDCGGEMEIMGAIFDHKEVDRYLKHVGLARSPPECEDFVLENDLTYCTLD